MNPCRYCSKMCFKVAPRSKAENSVQSSVRLTQIIYWQFRCGGTYLTLKVTYTYRVLVYLLCFYFILKRLWRAIYDQDWLPAAGPGGTVKLETTQSGVLNCYRMTLPESTPYFGDSNVTKGQESSNIWSFWRYFNVPELEPWSNSTGDSKTCSLTRGTFLYLGLERIFGRLVRSFT